MTLFIVNHYVYVTESLLFILCEHCFVFASSILFTKKYIFYNLELQNKSVSEVVKIPTNSTGNPS